MKSFVGSLDPGSVRDELTRAISGRGAFRNFKNIVFGGGDVALKHNWHWFETRSQREWIEEWLEDNGIEPKWDRDIFEPPSLPDKRPELLQAVLDFVRDAQNVRGVRRIALLGSLTTDKHIPKDVDLLIEIEDDDDIPLGPLAKRKRQLDGKTMQTGDGCGADVFLCNPEGAYLGRDLRLEKMCPRHSPILRSAKLRRSRVSLR